MKSGVTIFFLLLAAVAVVLIWRASLPFNAIDKNNSNLSMPETRHRINQEKSGNIIENGTEQIPQVEQKPSQRRGVDEFKQAYKKGKAVELALAEGPSVIPVLLEWLDTAKETQDKINALIVLGRLLNNLSDEQLKSVDTGIKLLNRLKKLGSYGNLPVEDKELYEWMLETIGYSKERKAFELFTNIASDYPPTQQICGVAVSAIFYSKDSESIEKILPLWGEKMEYYTAQEFINGLGKWGDPRAIPLLEQALDQQIYNAELIVKALGKLKAKSAVSRIAETLYNYSTESAVPVTAARALAEIGGKEAANALHNVATRFALEGKRESEVRIVALGGLARMGDRQAIELLTELLRDKEIDSSAKFKAGCELEEATGRKYGTDYEKWREFLERQQK